MVTLRDGWNSLFSVVENRRRTAKSADARSQGTLADAEAAAQQHLLDIAAHDKNDTLDGLHVETLLGARLRVVEPHCGESIRFL